MQSGIKIIIVCLFWTFVWSIQGETTFPVSSANNTYEVRADFGLETLQYKYFSLWENNSAVYHPQSIQAELDYDSYSSFPEWSKNVTFHSAQEFLYIDVAKSEGNIKNLILSIRLE